jgi:hypothetical protein
MMDAKRLREEANRCRRLANGINDPETVAELEARARDLEAEAKRLERAKHTSGC